MNLRTLVAGCSEESMEITAFAYTRCNSLHSLFALFAFVTLIAFVYLRCLHSLHFLRALHLLRSLQCSLKHTCTPMAVLVEAHLLWGQSRPTALHKSVLYTFCHYDVNCQSVLYTLCHFYVRCHFIRHCCATCVTVQITTAMYTVPVSTLLLLHFYNLANYHYCAHCLC
jgi:hypothetical protein